MSGNEPSSEPSVAKNLGKILTFVFIGVNLSGLGFGAFLVYSNTLGYESPMKRDEDLRKELASYREEMSRGPVLYTFNPITTNLSGFPARLIRVEMSLELLDREGFEEVFEKGPGARDSVNKILNSKKFDDLETVQGKLHLKNQIITQLNTYLTHGVVKNIYFSDFVVQ